MTTRLSYVSPRGTWFSGAVPPLGSDGYVSQFYLDTVTGDVYEKTAIATWTLRTIGSGGGGTITGGLNLGLGSGIYAGVSGTDLTFKSLIAGSNVSLTATATDITISSPSQIGQNLGLGSGVYGGLSGTDLTFKSLIAGTNIGLIPTATDITISSPSQIGQNLGLGSGVYGGLSGTDLTFKSLIAGTNIGLTGTATDITISSPSQIGQNLGAGSGIYAGLSGSDLTFKSIVAGNNISLAATATELTITSTAVSSVDSVGTGTSLVALPVGTAAKIKSIIAGSNITISSTADEVTINSTGGGGGGISGGLNLGTGTGVYAGVSGSDLTFKSLIAGTNVSITATASEITINASGGGGGSLTIIPDGGTLTGSYDGDVLLEGSVTLTSDVTIRGSIMSVFSPAGTLVTMGTHNFTISKDLLLPFHTLRSVKGGAITSLFVQGDCVAKEMDFSAVVGSGNSGSSIRVYGNLLCINAINLDAASGPATLGGNINCRGILQCESIRSNGGSSSTGGGNAGSISATQIYTGNITMNGGNATVTGNAGNGGTIEVRGDSLLNKGEIQAQTITMDGGTTIASGAISGNGGRITTSGNINAQAILIRGGSATDSSTGGTGGGGGTIYCEGSILLTSEFQCQPGVGLVAGAHTTGVEVRGDFKVLSTRTTTIFSPFNFSGANSFNQPSAAAPFSVRGDLVVYCSLFSGFGGNKTGTTSSNAAGNGAALRARNVYINASGTVSLNGGTNALGSGGSAGSMNVDDSIFVYTPGTFSLAGGSSTNGSGGNGGVISFASFLKVGSKLSTGATVFTLAGGSASAQSASVLSSGGVGGSILGKSGASSTLGGGDVIFENRNSSISLLGGICTGVGSTSLGLGGDGGSIVCRFLSGSVDARGNNVTTASGSGGNGGSIRVRDGMISGFASNLLSGGAAGPGSVGGNGGNGGSLFSEYGDVYVDTLNLNGANATVGNGGNGGTATVNNGTLICPGSLTFSGGASSGSVGGSGGNGGTITVGSLIVKSSTTGNGGNSSSGLVSGSGGSIAAILGNMKFSSGVSMVGGNCSTTTSPLSGNIQMGSGGSLRCDGTLIFGGNVALNSGNYTGAGGGHQVFGGNGGRISGNTTSGTSPDSVGGPDIVFAGTGTNINISLNSGIISATNSLGAQSGQGGILVARSFSCSRPTLTTVSNSVINARAGAVTSNLAGYTYIGGRGGVVRIKNGISLYNNMSPPGSVLTSINVNGGSCTGTGEIANGGAGGEIDLGPSFDVDVLSANGGLARVGGAGGTILLRENARVRTIEAKGGSTVSEPSSPSAETGSGGTITCYGSLESQFIDFSGGSIGATTVTGNAFTGSAGRLSVDGDLRIKLFVSGSGGDSLSGIWGTAYSVNSGSPIISAGNGGRISAGNLYFVTSSYSTLSAAILLDGGSCAEGTPGNGGTLDVNGNMVLFCDGLSGSATRVSLLGGSVSSGAATGGLGGNLYVRGMLNGLTSCDSSGPSTPSGPLNTYIYMWGGDGLGTGGSGGNGGNALIGSLDMKAGFDLSGGSCSVADGVSPGGGGLMYVSGLCKCDGISIRDGDGPIAPATPFQFTGFACSGMVEIGTLDLLAFDPTRVNSLSPKIGIYSMTNLNSDGSGLVISTPLSLDYGMVSFAAKSLVLNTRYGISPGSVDFYNPSTAGIINAAPIPQTNFSVQYRYQMTGSSMFRFTGVAV